MSTYTYNGDNLRQTKTVNGPTTQHIYNGMNVVEEKDSSGLKATYYRVGNQIVYSNVGGSNNFYIYNGHGDVTKLLDSNNKVVADYSYKSDI